MYSVQELARMYNCTRQTIYSKMDNPDIQTYIIKGDKRLRLVPEGLNILNVMMAESKVNKNEQEIYKKQDINHTTQSPVQMMDINKYIDELKDQIECLKVDKGRLYLQLEQQSKMLLLAPGEKSKKDDEIESLKNTLQQALEKMSELDMNNKKSWLKRLLNINILTLYLKGANLTGADLNQAILLDVNLEGANLSQANLSETRMQEVHLADVNLTDARF